MRNGVVFKNSNAAFMGCCFDVNLATTADPVWRLWDFLLNGWFGPISCRISDERMDLASDDERELLLLENRFIEGRTSAYEPCELRERPIFRVLCKSPTLDTSDGWGEVRTRLIRCLPHSNPVSTRMYGAVAIGLTVELYEWDGSDSNNARPRILHQGAINLAKPKDRHTLDKLLDEIEEKMKENPEWGQYPFRRPAAN